MRQNPALPAGYRVVMGPRGYTLECLQFGVWEVVETYTSFSACLAEALRDARNAFVDRYGAEAWSE